MSMLNMRERVDQVFKMIKMLMFLGSWVLSIWVGTEMENLLLGGVNV
jgi:hypothetical protein